MAKRHKKDTATYRELGTHKERVQSFNATAKNLTEEVRVQVEMDAGSKRKASDIVDKRIKTLEKAIKKIKQSK